MSSPPPIWQPFVDNDGNYSFKKDNVRVAPRGVSLSGLEYLPSDDKDTTNILLSFFDPSDPSSQTIQNFTTIVNNLVTGLVISWKVNIIRVPICVSAYSTDVGIFFAGDKRTYSYPHLVKIVVNAILQRDAVALIDGHVWAVDKRTKRFLYERACTFRFRDNLRPGNTQNYGNQSYALQDLMDLETGRPFADVRLAWEVIVSDMMKSFKNHQGIWFEPVNEPFFRPFKGAEKKYAPRPVQYQKWKFFFRDIVRTIRRLSPESIIVVNGLDRGYDLELAVSDWRKNGPIFGRQMRKVAFGAHLFQIAGCCGLITAPGDDPAINDRIRRDYVPYRKARFPDDPAGFQFDQSGKDPYERAYCHFPGQISETVKNPQNMRGGAFSIVRNNKRLFFDLPAANQNQDLVRYKCDSSISRSISAKLPPCRYDNRLVDTRTGTNFVGTFVGDCPPAVIRAMEDDERIPASGWDRYVLPMARFAPVVITAFGTFDCSLPYIRAFLDYADRYNLSWVAFGIQPYLPSKMYVNGLNPCNLSCLTIPIVNPYDDGLREVRPVNRTKKVVGNYYECLDASNVPSVIAPIGSTGQLGDVIKSRIVRSNQKSIPPLSEIASRTIRILPPEREVRPGQITDGNVPYLEQAGETPVSPTTSSNIPVGPVVPTTTTTSSVPVGPVVPTPATPSSVPVEPVAPTTTTSSSSVPVEPVAPTTTTSSSSVPVGPVVPTPATTSSVPVGPQKSETISSTYKVVIFSSVFGLIVIVLVYVIYNRYTNRNPLRDCVRYLGIFLNFIWNSVVWIFRYILGVVIPIPPALGAITA